MVRCAGRDTGNRQLRRARPRLTRRIYISSLNPLTCPGSRSDEPRGVHFAPRHAPRHPRLLPRLTAGPVRDKMTRSSMRRWLARVGRSWQETDRVANPVNIRGESGVRPWNSTRFTADPPVGAWHRQRRGRSSIGRALRSQCRGWRFEPARLHVPESRKSLFFSDLRLFSIRRGWDSNPRREQVPYRFSRPAPSATRPPLQG